METDTTEFLTQKPLEQLALELAELDPRPMTNFTPDNLSQTMEDFLSGNRRNPDGATYSKLDAIDFDERENQYREILSEILSRPDVPSKQHRVYQAYVERSIDINELMRQASLYRRATSEVDKQAAQQIFSELNEKLYSKPDAEIAASMAKEIYDDSKSIEDQAVVKIREEFMNLLPSNLIGDKSEFKRSQPSEEAKETVARAVELMYSGMLKHADELIDLLVREEGTNVDDLEIAPQAIAVIFQTIIDKEFPDSGWKVSLTDANAINVDASTKTVKVPLERKSSSAAEVRGLVVHELGVHMVRSMIGENADLMPLRFGLAGYNEAEEGIANVMESVLADDASRTGYQHYLTATLLGSGKDFRDTFEIMWRYKVLDEYLDKPESVDEEYINEQKKNTFKFMFRSIRGTNELPWHVTLNYFEGTHKIWDYIERHKGDPDMITLMFMGKIDPTNLEHLRGALDAKGKE